MKKLSVYPVFLILLGFGVVFCTSCSRKSGCAVNDKSSVSVKKKRSTGNRDLFGQR